MKLITDDKVSNASISVIGGGRWARVILQIICNIVDKQTHISVVSKSNALGMAEWIRKNNIRQGKVEVLTDLPKKFITQNHSVIVVNAARDHVKTVLSSLNAGANVLVEKPIALNYLSGKEMIKTAKKVNKILASSHVFLFANYFLKYIQIVKQAGPINGLKIHWEDPRNENRYGEMKLYDAGLPVFADWMPHTLSMVNAFISIENTELKELKFDRGGASIEIELSISGIPCSMRLVRNGNCRKREMIIETDRNKLKLDFSKEPGLIYDSENIIENDFDWNKNESPLTSLLKSFLNGVNINKLDERLNVEIGLNVLKIIDLVNEVYLEKQMNWVKKSLEKQEFNNVEKNLDDSIEYALAEIFQKDRSLTSEELKKQIERVLLMKAQES